MREYSTTHAAIYLVVITFIFGSSSVSVDKITPQLEMIGHWEGTGRIIVAWCEADSLVFSLEMFQDGSVEGTVGDATLSHGYIKMNAWLNRWFGNPEYLIGGYLDGPIVASEDIYRESLHWLMVDLIDGELRGGFHTSGSKGNSFGNEKDRKKSMKMSGVEVVLKKVQ